MLCLVATCPHDAEVGALCTYCRDLLPDEWRKWVDRRGKREGKGREAWAALQVFELGPRWSMLSRREVSVVIKHASTRVYRKHQQPKLDPKLVEQEMLKHRQGGEVWFARSFLQTRIFLDTGRGYLSRYVFGLDGVQHVMHELRGLAAASGKV